MYSRIIIKNFRGSGRLEVDGLRLNQHDRWAKQLRQDQRFWRALFLSGRPQSRISHRAWRKCAVNDRSRRYRPIWRPLFHNLDPRGPVEIQDNGNQSCGERTANPSGPEGTQPYSIRASQAIEGSGSSSVGRELPVGRLEYEYTGGT